MPVNIKRILYATDLSLTSPKAYVYAVKLAKALDAKIVILHVIEELQNVNILPVMAPEIIEKHYKDFETQGRQLIKDRIERMCITEFKDPTCVNLVESVEVVIGHPFEEILNKADKYACDMIVMGSHGKGMLAHALLGRVAERVLRHAKKPVLVIPVS